jgi:hypothetical protein
MNADQLASAKRELEKLPLLGPALWLFARDPMRRFTFVADIDWRLLPPLVLDQCKLYSREGLPWAFVTWARVGDAVDQRLRSSAPGSHAFAVDAPDIARQALKEIAGASTANAWLPGAEGGSVLHVVRRDG